MSFAAHDVTAAYTVAACGDSGTTAATTTAYVTVPTAIYGAAHTAAAAIDSELSPPNLAGVTRPPSLPDWLQ